MSWNYRLPFDQFQRYRLAAEIVSILEGDGPPGRVLEVGGFPSRLPDFLPGRQITVADPTAAGPSSVRADGRTLPFADRSFDLVISLDTLEHIPPTDRKKFIAELCRTAAKSVMVAAPFHSEAVRAADRTVFEFIRAQAGYEHPYLKEHLQWELPDLVETLVQMVDHGLDVQVIPSGRLDRWLFMMTAYYTLDSDLALQSVLPFLMEAYNRAFYDHDKAEPAYRHFLIGNYAPLGRRWRQLAEQASPAEGETGEASAVALVLELGRVLALKAKEQKMAALCARLEATEAELAALREYTARLEDFHRRVTSFPLYSFYEKYLKPSGRK